MSRGVNKVILVGNCGQDPETKYLPSGNAVTNISIATAESWKDKQTGEKQEKTEWHRVVFFNRLAEVAGEYLRKGNQVYIEGSLRTRKWQGQDGQDRYTTEIVASEMQMLGGKQDGQQGTQQGGQQQNQQPQPQQQQPQQQQNQRQPAQQPVQQQSQQNNHQQRQQQAPQQQAPAPNFDNFDDDIPFR